MLGKIGRRSKANFGDNGNELNVIIAMLFEYIEYLHMKQNMPSIFLCTRKAVLLLESQYFRQHSSTENSTQPHRKLANKNKCAVAFVFGVLLSSYSVLQHNGEIGWLGAHQLPWFYLINLLVYKIFSICGDFVALYVYNFVFVEHHGFISLLVDNNRKNQNKNKCNATYS